MSTFDNEPVSDFVNSFPAEGTPEVMNQPAAPDVQATPPTTQPQVTDPSAPPSQTEVESLIEQAKIDLNGLPEEQQIYLRQREREMQSHMTRRLQEASAERQEAAQSMQFLNALNSDPQFAMQVLSQIQGNLAAAGYQFDESADSWDDGTDEYGDAAGPDPYVQQELAALRAEQEQIQQYFVEQNLSAQLDNQLNQIQTQHPEYGDQDIQAIIDMGYATGGDLMAAAEQYGAVNDAVISRYLQSKASVNTPAPLSNASGQAQPAGTGLKTDEELRNAAMERLRNAFG